MSIVCPMPHNWLYLANVCNHSSRILLLPCFHELHCSRTLVFPSGILALLTLTFSIIDSGFISFTCLCVILKARHMSIAIPRVNFASRSNNSCSFPLAEKIIQSTSSYSHNAAIVRSSVKYASNGSFHRAFQNRYAFTTTFPFGAHYSSNFSRRLSGRSLSPFNRPLEMIIYAYEFGYSAVKNDCHLRCVRFLFFFRGSHIHLKLPFSFLKRIGEIRLVNIHPERRAKMSTVSHCDSSREAG